MGLCFLQFVSFPCRMAEYLGGVDNLTACCSPSNVSRTTGNSVILLSFQLVLHVTLIPTSLVLPGRVSYLISLKKREKCEEWAMSRVFFLPSLSF